MTVQECPMESPMISKKNIGCDERMLIAGLLLQGRDPEEMGLVRDEKNRWVIDSEKGFSPGMEAESLRILGVRTKKMFDELSHVPDVFIKMGGSISDHGKNYIVLPVVPTIRRDLASEREDGKEAADDSQEREWIEKTLLSLLKEKGIQAEYYSIGGLPHVKIECSAGRDSYSQLDNVCAENKPLAVIRHICEETEVRPGAKPYVLVDFNSIADAQAVKFFLMLAGVSARQMGFKAGPQDWQGEKGLSLWPGLDGSATFWCRQGSLRIKDMTREQFNELYSRAQTLYNQLTRYVIKDCEISAPRFMVVFDSDRKCMVPVIASTTPSAEGSVRLKTMLEKNALLNKNDISVDDHVYNLAVPLNAYTGADHMTTLERALETAQKYQRNPGSASRSTPLP